MEDQDQRTISIKQSHGGSGKQARAVIDGLGPMSSPWRSPTTSTPCSKTASCCHRTGETVAEQCVALHLDHRVLVRKNGRRRSGTGTTSRPVLGSSRQPGHPAVRWNYHGSMGLCAQASRAVMAKRAPSTKSIFDNVKGARFRRSRRHHHLRGTRRGDVLIAWENGPISPSRAWA